MSITTMDSEIIEIEQLQEDILNTVTFHNVEDTYSPLLDLVCRYSVRLEELDKHGNEFWVAIFKVGWESTEDFLTKESFEKTTGGRSVGLDLIEQGSLEIFKTVFGADCLPESNDEEFYQFCFLTEKDCVLGASCPFQIKEVAVLLSRPSSVIDSVGLELEEQAKNELEWCPWFEVSGEDVDGAILVHNKTTMLEKSLANMAEENSVLRDHKEKLENENEALRREILEIEHQKGIVERLLLQKRKQEESDMKQLDELQEQLEMKNQSEKIYETKLSELKHQVHMSQIQLNNSRLETESLDALLKEERGQERDKLIREFEAKIKIKEQALEETKEALRLENEAKALCMIKCETDIGQLKRSMETLLTDVAEKQNCIDQLKENKDVLMQDLRREQENILLLKMEYENIMAAKENKIKELQELNDLLNNASDQKILDLQNEVTTGENLNQKLREEVDEISKKLAEETSSHDLERANFEQELTKTKHAVRDCEVEVICLKEEVKTLKSENIGLKEKVTGPRHALQVAYHHTQKQLSQLKSENEQLQQQCQGLKQQTSGDLQKQVEDLKLRLCMGANAYKEKFLECKRLQSELKKLQENAQSTSPAIPNVRNPDVSSKGLTENVETLKNRLKSVEEELSKARRNAEESSVLKAEVSQVKDDSKSKAKKNEKLKEQLEKTKKEHEKVVFALTTEIKKLEEVVSEKEERLRTLKQAEEDLKRDQEIQEEEEGKVRERLEGLREENVHLKEENAELIRKLEEAKNKSAAASSTEPSNQPVISTQPQPIQSPPKGFPANKNSDQLRTPEPFTIYKPPLYEEQLDQLFEGNLRPHLRNTYVPDGADVRRPISVQPEPGAEFHPEHNKPPKKSSSGKDRLAPETCCPICNMEFPPGYSEKTASEHINGHFSN